MQQSDPCINLPPVGYMPESEVRSILQNFNSTLAGFVFQIEELTRSRSILASRLAFAEKENQFTRAHMNELQVELDHTKVELKIKETELERLRAFTDEQAEVGLEEHKAYTAKVEGLRASLCLSPEGSEAVELMNQIIEEVRRLTSLNWSITSEFKNLRAEVLRKESQEAQPVKCLKCKLLYVPQMNSKEACIFHSGKLKFYSCKGCGADAYYTCCNMCETCCHGCKTGPHLPMNS